MTDCQIEVLHPGLLTTIQGSPNSGRAFYGIPAGGPMDPKAAALANRLIGNPIDTPILECNLLAPRLRFGESIDLVLTGADCAWQADGRDLVRNQVHHLGPGSVLSGGYSTNGARAYIAFASHYSVTRNQALRIQPLCSHPLYQGQIITVEHRNLPVQPKMNAAIEDYERIDIIRLQPGPEWQQLSSTSQKALLSQPFTIDPNSNRIGARLTGPNLTLNADGNMPSVPVIPGVIQLPGSGRPIVVLRDGPTTGGYPRIATISEAELGQFNQISPGRHFRFINTDSDSTATANRKHPQ